MTFADAYALHGPDTIAISEALGIPEHEADRLINAELERAREEKGRTSRSEYLREYRKANKERLIELRNRHNARIRAELREIRARRPA